MGTFVTKEGVSLFYKDHGEGKTVVLSHGWPLSSDAWDGQVAFLLAAGYRVIAHDRRGHGRSTQTWKHNTMDQFADDLDEFIEHLNLRDVVLVGHSTGGGEVTRYIGRHGTKRLAGLVLLGAVPPLMLKTQNNPGGLPREVFDGIRQNTFNNRSQFFKDLTIAFYGYNREGAVLSQGICDAFWLQGMMGGIKAQLDCIEAFSETDFTQDLKKVDVPTLVVHGDDDQIVPIGNAALLSAKLVQGSQLLIYHGAPHGIAQTHQDRFNKDLLKFLKTL